MSLTIYNGPVSSLLSIIYPSQSGVPSPTHTQRKCLGQGHVPCFPSPEPAIQQVDIVEKGMNQSINQWVLRNLSTLTIYYPLPKPFFSSPLAPFKGPWAYLACTPLHMLVTPTHLQHHYPPHPYPELSQAANSPEARVSLILGYTPLPGPGFHTQQTSDTCWGAGWVFWAEIPKASEPTITLCNTTHCPGHFYSRFVYNSTLPSAHRALPAHHPLPSSPWVSSQLKKQSGLQALGLALGPEAGCAEAAGRVTEGRNEGDGLVSLSLALLLPGLSFLTYKMTSCWSLRSLPAPPSEMPQLSKATAQLPPIHSAYHLTLVHQKVLPVV